MSRNTEALAALVGQSCFRNSAGKSLRSSKSKMFLGIGPFRLTSNTHKHIIPCMTTQAHNAQVDMNECKKVRLSFGDTQVEFAERLAVSQSTISRWESGDLAIRPRDVMLFRLLEKETAA